jgi:hypothetical protein
MVVKSIIVTRELWATLVFGVFTLPKTWVPTATVVLFILKIDKAASKKPNQRRQAFPESTWPTSTNQDSLTTQLRVNRELLESTEQLHL